MLNKIYGHEKNFKITHFNKTNTFYTRNRSYGKCCILFKGNSIGSNSKWIIGYYFLSLSTAIKHRLYVFERRVKWHWKNVPGGKRNLPDRSKSVGRCPDNSGTLRSPNLHRRNNRSSCRYKRI